RLVARCLVVLGLAGLIIITVLGGLAQQLGNNDNTLFSQQVGFVGCPPLLCRGSLVEQMANLRQAAAIGVPAGAIYFGGPLIALALLAWRAGPNRARRPFIWLSLSTVAMLLAFPLTARNVPPRYYSFLAVPVTALAACGLAAAARGRIRFGPPRESLKQLARLLAVGLAFQATALVGPVILTPERARLPEIDHWQYFSGPPAGTGIDQAALNFLVQPASVAPLVIAKLTYTYALSAYLDQSRVKQLTWQDDWAPDA